MNEPRPQVVVDLIIEVLDGTHEKIVLVERTRYPTGLALPGGHIEGNETAAQAAVREAFEETGLKLWLTGFLGVYSKPGRDPRGAKLSLVFIGTAAGAPRSKDPAIARAFLAVPGEWPGRAMFDHEEIVGDYLAFKLTGQRKPLQRW